MNLKCHCLCGSNVTSCPVRRLPLLLLQQFEDGIEKYKKIRFFSLENDHYLLGKKDLFLLKYNSAVVISGSFFHKKNRMSSLTKPLINTLLGAMVGDAAALGYHWLYTTNQLKGQPRETYEFAQPREANFVDAKGEKLGYFAHHHDVAGDVSWYTDNWAKLWYPYYTAHGTATDAFGLERKFFHMYGPESGYVGYHDAVIRGFLANIHQAEQRALDLIDKDDFFATREAEKAKVKDALQKTLRSVESPQNIGDDLFKRLPDASSDVLHAVKRLLEGITTEVSGPKSVSDDQGSAVVWVPAIVCTAVAANPTITEAQLDAIVVSELKTFINDEKNPYVFAKFYARVLLHALRGESPVAASRHAVDSLKKEQPDSAKALEGVLEALETNESYVEFQERVGTACHLGEMMPGAILCVKQHTTAAMKRGETYNAFVEAARDNILAGGDSCARGIIVGAIIAATEGQHGGTPPPAVWLDRLSPKAKGIAQSIGLLPVSS